MGDPLRPSSVDGDTLLIGDSSGDEGNVSAFNSAYFLEECGLEGGLLNSAGGAGGIKLGCIGSSSSSSS